MGTTTRKPIEIDWGAINGAMDDRSRADFNRLFRQIGNLASDINNRLSFDCEAKIPVRFESAKAAQDLCDLITEIPCLTW